MKRTSIRTYGARSRNCSTRAWLALKRKSKRSRQRNKTQLGGAEFRQHGARRLCTFRWNPQAMRVRRPRIKVSPTVECLLTVDLRFYNRLEYCAQLGQSFTIRIDFGLK